MAKVRREGKLERVQQAWVHGQYRGLILAGELLAQEARRRSPRLTGRLKRSIAVSTPVVKGHRVSVRVGTNVVYAAVQEFGGTIVPRQAKMLAIPIGNRRGSPRRYNDLHIIRTRSGSVLLVDQSGEAHYLLVPKVTIPAHPYLRPAFRARQNDVIRIVLRSMLGAMGRVR